MFCQCMWGGGAAPSPSTPLQPFFLTLASFAGIAKHVHTQHKKKTIPDPFAFAARAGLWWWWCVLVLVPVRLLSLALLVPLCWCLWCFERVPCCPPHSLAAAGAAIFVLGAGAACNGDTFECIIFITRIFSCLGRTAGAGVLLVVVAAVVEGGGGWVGGGGAAAAADASATGACAHILQPKFRNSKRNQKKYRTVLHH